MLVNLRRSQDEGWFSTSYVLEAKIDLTDDEARLVAAHGLGAYVIFDSANVDYYANATTESAGSIGYVQPTKEPFFDILASFYTSLYHLGATAYNAVMWSFSAQITVDSLISGERIESEDADEILLAEGLIRQAADNLKNLIIELSHFDGSESYHEV